jgi:hypothetical protein
MRNDLFFRRSRYAFASLLVAGSLISGAACAKQANAGQPPPPATGLSVSPTTANYGSVSFGSESAPVTFTVKNNGPSPSEALSVFTEGTDPAAFSWAPADDTCSDNPLAVGAECTVSVSFIPQQGPTGDKTADLVAKTNDPADGEARAALKGTATQ